MGLFSRKRQRRPDLDREQALSARPALNRLVKFEKQEDGCVRLRIPRRDTTMRRMLSRVFRLPTHKKIALDELGSFVIELCDGRHTVKQIADEFAGRFKLSRREAEVSVSTFLRTLAGRSIIVMLIMERNEG